VAAFAARAAARHPSFPLVTRSFRRLDRTVAWSLLRIGAPGMAVGVLFSTVYMFLSGIAARLGTVPLAVLGLGNRSESLTYLVSNGFAAATATMVGQNLGAGRPERAERAAWLSALWMGLYGLVIGGVLVAWPHWILSLFTSDTAVLELGTNYVRVLGTCQSLMAIEIVFENAFSGAGDNVPPMVISVPMNVLRVPLVLWVVRVQHAGMLGIACVLVSTAMARGILAAVWFRRGGWKHHAL
jgi:Na+-driven multidrug efflux pump